MASLRLSRATSSRRIGAGWTRPLAAAIFFSLALTSSSQDCPLDSSPPELSPAGERNIELVAEALTWLGTPYRYGGRSAEGVDCSGFVRAVLSAIGLGDGVPDRSENFASYGEKAEGEIEPGDILLFAHEKHIDHVGIALSEDSFIHAASSGPRTGVIVSSLSEHYWKSSFVGARRLDEGGE
jgi:hypothetical protein